MSGSTVLLDPDRYLLEEGADDVLLGLLARDNEPPPHYVLAEYRREPTPVEGFDKVAFRRHMRRLIEQREQHREFEEARRLAHEEARRRQAEVLRQALEAAREAVRAESTRRAYEYERRELDRLLAREATSKAPKPPPAPPPNHPGYTVTWPGEHKQQNVEPWFDLSKPLTLSHLRCIAQYTLGYFVAARRLPPIGTAHIGEMTTRAECLRDADAIATAMMQIAIPKSARYSACLLDVPDGIIAVTLGSPHVALRLASVEEGRRVSIEVTWDHGH